jgi:hypothetical protein
MQKTVLTLIVLLIFVMVISTVNAAMEATGNVAPIQKGENVLAASAHNDSPGSSDLTLIVQLQADDDILVDEGDECKAIQPLENIPNDADPTGWTKLDFDDSDWQEGQNGVGYGDGDDNTDIGDGQHATVYMRIMFNIANVNAIQDLVLGVDYDDAAVIYLNGVQVARTPGTDIPDEPTWDSWSDQGSGQSHEASKADPPNYETVDLEFQVTTAVQPLDKLASLWGNLK